MSDVFWVEPNFRYSFAEVVEMVNKKHDSITDGIIETRESYDIFIMLLVALSHGDEITLEKNSVIYRKVEDEKVSKLKFSNFEDVVEAIKNNKTSKVELYTAGTTGTPKMITHTINTLIRNIKVNELRRKDIWALTYPLYHMAGIQVFFQAVFNKNKLINIYNVELKHAMKMLEAHNTTNISGTPTFYRGILPYFRESKLLNLKIITLGGEKVSADLMTTLTNLFPQSTINNIYASTEAASLFLAKGEFFSIPKELMTYVKINDLGELLLHKSLLGNIIDNDNEWYYTGDIVEETKNRGFKIVSRKSETINVGGYKINPYNVEEILKKCPLIDDILVFSMKNSVTGEILAADIVANKEIVDFKKQVKSYAETVLPKWEIPRIINIVKDIPQNTVGKRIRK